MREVITETVNNQSVFVPNAFKDQLNELFKNCVSKDCIPEALVCNFICLLAFLNFEQ